MDTENDRLETQTESEELEEKRELEKRGGKCD